MEIDPDLEMEEECEMEAVLDSDSDGDKDKVAELDCVIDAVGVGEVLGPARCNDVKGVNTNPLVSYGGVSVP
jgi:hypothetical protein